LISDRGVRGAVIHLAGEFKQAQWREEDDAIAANVGPPAPWRNWCAKRRAKATRVWNLPKAFPAASAALYMNAGAFGSEFEKVVDQVEAMTPRGEPLHLARAQMTFSYRDSHLPEGTVITRVH
jgi:UDP-N-acetylenolpyruvoylglucosamine reductase